MLNNPQINNSSRHRESNNNNKNLGKQYNRINTFIDMQTSALRRIKILRLFYRNAPQKQQRGSKTEKQTQYTYDTTSFNI